MSTIQDLMKKYLNLQNFLIKIKISGKNIDINYKIASFEFDGSTNGEASICTAKWQAECYDELGNLSINNSFHSSQIGSKFDVSAGYYNSSTEYSTQIFSGFIFSSSIVLENGISYLKISAMDAKICMMANNVTKFKSTGGKYSKIVKDVADKYSSKFSKINIDISEEPRSIRPGLHQRNESDFDYLNRIANITGSIFYVVNGNLFFTSLKHNNYDKLVIKPTGKIQDGNLIQSVEFKSNIVGIPKYMSINYTESELYSEMKNSKTDSLSKIGSGKIADDLTSNINENNLMDLTSTNVDSLECAEFLAKSAYLKRSINLAKCRLVCKFLPDIKIGSSVSMSGFGNPIDNSYIVSSLNHKYNGIEFKTIINLSTDCFSQEGETFGRFRFNF